MRQQLIASILLLVFAGTALLIKSVYFQSITKDGAFLFQLAIWICGFLGVILGLNVLWQVIGRQTQSSVSKTAGIVWPNRRQCFRLVYPASLRPMLIIERSGSQPLRQLEYQVADISEGGLCFLDDGTLAAIEEFSGRLIFKQGNSLRISGRIIRREGDRISIQLHRNLAWQTILKEQRNLICSSQ